MKEPISLANTSLNEKGLTLDVSKLDKVCKNCTTTRYKAELFPVTAEGRPMNAIGMKLVDEKGQFLFGLDSRDVSNQEFASHTFLNGKSIFYETESTRRPQIVHSIVEVKDTETKDVEDSQLTFIPDSQE